jgi:bacterioferritin (cytochrome b1)
MHLNFQLTATANARTDVLTDQISDLNVMLIEKDAIIKNKELELEERNELTSKKDLEIAQKVKELTGENNSEEIALLHERLEKLEKEGLDIDYVSYAELNHIKQQYEAQIRKLKKQLLDLNQKKNKLIIFHKQNTDL